MHYITKPPPRRANDGRRVRQVLETDAASDFAQRRQDAVSCLEAAAATQDQAQRESLRRRAAELLAPNRRR
jgi:DNA-binding GntR family transcriptional regulator